MAEHQRLIKILSDGTLSGSNFIDAETGETLKNVASVDIRITGIDPPRATFEVVAPAMDITVSAEVEQVGWIADLYLQIKELRQIVADLAATTSTDHILHLVARANRYLEQHPEEEPQP